MKKVSVFFIAVMATLSGFAQTEKAGSFGTELYLKPWNTNETFSLIDGAKVRYFFTEELAVRASLNFYNNTTTEFSYVNNGSKDIETKKTNSYSNFGIAPGLEYHLFSTEKLSIYVGAQLSADFRNASYNEENDDNDVKITKKGANSNGDFSGFTLGAGIFTGIDYYVISNRLYIGAELGLGYETFSSSEIVTKTTNGSGTTTENKVKDYVRDSRLGFYCLPSVRLGWNF